MQTLHSRPRLAHAAERSTATRIASERERHRQQDVLCDDGPAGFGMRDSGKLARDRAAREHERAAR